MRGGDQYTVVLRKNEKGGTVSGFFVDKRSGGSISIRGGSVCSGVKRGKGEVCG